MVQRGKEWGKVVGKVVYHESRTWFKKERKGEVVGKVVSHESKTWFKEERNGGK